MINAEDPRAHEQYNGIEIQLNWVKIGHTSTRQAYQSLNDVHKGQGPQKVLGQIENFPENTKQSCLDVRNFAGFHVVSWHLVD
jgi:hypothetical protein